MAESEVARFREQQALGEQAAHLGLSGFAITAHHDFIVARAQRGAERILQLIAEGKDAEALILMNEPDWGLETEEPHQSKKKRVSRKDTERSFSSVETRNHKKRKG